MNGAETLVRTLLASGVDTCFANPGTSEMHFVAALDRVPGMRCVLCLFEGVATGAADGYGADGGEAGGHLLHCGPGLANGLANLHNARRAQTPDRQRGRRPGDPSSPARPAADRRHRRPGARGFSAWTRVAQSVRRIGADAAAAVQAARTAHGQIATLIAARRRLLGRRRHRSARPCRSRRPARSRRMSSGRSRRFSAAASRPC